MSLGIGKTICIPPSSMIPNGVSIAALIQDSGAKALLTVPSILEEIESLPDKKGHEVLRRLDFVAFGGGMLKRSAGERLESAGVRLISQYGATETGPLTPFLYLAGDTTGVDLGCAATRLDRSKSDSTVSIWT